MRHNEKELPAVRRLAEELDVDYFAIKTVDLCPAHEGNLDSHYAPDDIRYRRYEYKPGTYARKHRPFECMRPWKRITLDVSGEVISCEYDFDNSLSFGNINNEQSSVSVWKGMKSREFRKKFNRGDNSFYHCKDCSYKNNIYSDCVIKKESFKSFR